MRDLYVCPRCKHTRTKNYGKTRHVGKSGDYTSYRKCLDCGSNFDVTLSTDFRKVRGFPLPTKDQAVRVILSGDSDDYSSFLVTVGAALFGVTVTPDVAFAAGREMVKLLSESGQFMKLSGVRLAALGGRDTLANTGEWCTTPCVDLTGYLSHDKELPLRLSRDSGTAAVSWALRYGVSVIVQGEPEGDLRGWETYFRDLRQVPHVPLRFEGSDTLENIWENPPRL